MADKTGISWTDATWNPIAGCSLVSPGCTNCYAMKMAARIEAMSAGSDKQTHYAGTTMATKAGAVWTGKIGIAGTELFTQPLRWKRPRRIFVNSMSDLFHEDVPDHVIDQVFAIMALCPQHTFQVLTKRPARMRAYLTGVTPLRRLADRAAGEFDDDKLFRRFQPWCNIYSFYLERTFPLANVWLGVSVEDQARANERIPDLLATPAAVRWISAEPLLGAVDVARYMHDSTCRLIASNGLEPCTCHEPYEARIDWVVAGGESGPGARPMHPDWARSLRDQCKDTGVPFFFKQWGEWSGHTIAPNGQITPPIPATAFKSIAKLRRWADGIPLALPPNASAADAFKPGTISVPTGKSAAGDLLDGVQRHAWPKVEP